MLVGRASTRRFRRRGYSALAAVLAVACTAAAPSVLEAPVLRIEVTPLLVGAGTTRALEPFAIEATREEAASGETSVPWSPSGPPAKLSLEVTVGSENGGEERLLRLDAAVAVGSSPPVRSHRDLTLTEGSTGLFDVLQEGDRRLVLSIRAEEVLRPVSSLRRKAGSPVLFLLAIERRDGERSVPLETNRLVTFLGEGVEYSFASGGADRRESLRLVLKPVRIEGDVAEVEVDVTGSLPGANGPILLSRRERIITSRRATSSVVVTAGDPPAGYRFLVTPDF